MDAKNESGKFIPGISVLRGGSVSILINFKCEEDGEEYSIITIQPRVPTSSFLFSEIPAGMIDDSHHFAGGFYFYLFFYFVIYFIYLFNI